MPTQGDPVLVTKRKPGTQSGMDVPGCRVTGLSRTSIDKLGKLRRWGVGQFHFVVCQYLDNVTRW